MKDCNHPLSLVGVSQQANTASYKPILHTGSYFILEICLIPSMFFWLKKPELPCEQVDPFIVHPHTVFAPLGYH